MKVIAQSPAGFHRRVLLFWLAIGPFSAPFLLIGDWQPEVSLAESWRWAQLEILDDYEIIRGASGQDDAVWFVHTEGLARYDGYTVEDFPIPSLSGRSVIDLKIVSDGRIIINAEDHLLVWSENREQIFSSPNGEYFIRNGIVETQDDRLIAATNRSLYEVGRDKLIKIETGNTHIDSLLLDANENLWVGEADKPIKVYKLELVAERFVVDLFREFSSSRANNYFPHFFLDSRDRVWVIDPDETDQCYLYENYERKPALRSVLEESLLSDSLSVTEPVPGELWLCASRTLAHWDGDRLKAYHIEDFPIPSSYPYILNLPGDRILLGGQKLTPQIINLSTERWTTYVGLDFQCEDSGGGLWFIAEDRRIVRKLEESWKIFDQSDAVIDTPNRVIVASDGTIWASGSNRQVAAVSYFDGEKWRLYSFPDVGLTFSHLAALETTEGEILFGGGTVGRMLGDAPGGAVVFRKKGNAYEGIHYPPPTFASRTANIVERKGDGLLFSLESVYRVRSDDSYVSQTKDLFSRQWIDHMIVDKRNDLWVACLGVGVYQYNGDKWIIHGRQTGLETKNVIYLLEDTIRDRILALTDRGFFQFDGTSWTPWGFPMDLPLKRENHTVFQSSDSAIWLNFSSRSWLLELKGFGRHNYKFQTIRYMPDTVPPETTVSMPTDRFPEGGQIQLEFGGSDFWGDTPKQELVYSWSLNGNIWSPFTDRSSITFSGLDGGKYELLVRARDRDGNVDGTPHRTVFRVIPPLWKRAWFIMVVLIAITLIVFLLYALYRVRIKAALALDEFKFDFFTNISHELRNPLAVIISPVEMLLDSDFDAGTRKKLQIVLRNARKMQVMVDQLLAFRQIEKGHWTLNYEGGEIIGFTRDAVMNNEPLWQKKNQALSFKSGRESHLCSFDPGIAQKMIDNLVSNAIKYSEEQATIRVQAGIESVDGHEQFIFEIEDDGPGIPLHEQKHVLQPFYRIRHSTREEGSGVGLALVNQLVKLCGGAIEITSPVAEGDRGTRFRVVLPLEPYRPPVQEKAPEIIPSSVENGKPTVLFVEDNEDMRHILCDAFSDEYGVIEAGDGDSGLAAAIKHNPDIIVSDIMMPGISGLELCERLKTDPETSHIPVVLLTARSSVEHRIEGIQCGADAYIPKPLDVKHLRARVENLLESRTELKRRFSKQLVIEATEITVTPTDEKILHQAIQIVEAHMRDEDFDVDRFASLMGMSRSSLKRKVKAITGQSPQPFIQKLRLKRAAQLLTSGDMPVSEVATMVGFYDVSYFGKVFKKEFGSAPSLYRESGEKLAT